MALAISRVQVWVGDLLNRPGMLARVLEALTNAGASLEFIIARRVSENTGRVFVAPVEAPEHQLAATDVGLVPAQSMLALRVEAPDRAGLAAEVARRIADAGVNIRGYSAATAGTRCVTYLAFAEETEVALAEAALSAIIAPEPPPPLPAPAAQTRPVAARKNKAPAAKKAPKAKKGAAKRAARGPARASKRRQTVARPAAKSAKRSPARRKATAKKAGKKSPKRSAVKARARRSKRR